MTQSSVSIQITPESAPSIPSWFAEVAAFAQVLTQAGILKVVQEQVRFARARFGQYDLIDFVVVLIGYAVSSEPTLKAFYERLLPFAEPFMALFGRHLLPHRSTLSRFLAALDQASVEALRTLFQEDLVARSPFASPGGMFDRRGKPWLVVDVDGTRQAARQRALPSLSSLPAPHRRFEQVCAPAYLGRKRGEVARTRTVIVQAHTHQLMGTFGGPGNGDYRGELVRAIQVITSYATKLALPLAQVLLRLDGLYGDAAPLIDVLGAGLGVIARSRDYTLLGLEVVKQALARSPDQVRIHEDKRDDPCALRLSSRCLDADRTEVGVWWWPPMPPLPLSHPSASSVTVWSTSCLSAPFACPAFTSSDVLDLYLHRGSFETVLADEDVEQDPDRWCSHTPNGQECWQILCQWVWNLRLELGQQLSSSALRTTEFAEAVVVEPEPCVEPAPVSTQTPPVKYGPPNFARPSFTHGFPGSAFTLQPDGTLRCPADRPLYPQERRPERDGSIRLLYAARIGHCRCCPLRAQCQESSSSVKPRRVSAVLWPLESSLSDASPPLEDAPEALPLAPVLWKDWPRCHIRRAWLKIIRSETIGLTSGTTPTQEVFTRAQRAHWRLSWDQRVTRNARLSDAPRLFVTLHGLPATFAQSFGFALLATA